MFNFAKPLLVSLVFTYFTIGSNVLSNIWLGRSTYSLFFIQMAYQLSHAQQDANNFTKHHRQSFFDFGSAYDCFAYSKCQYATYAAISCSFIFILISAFALKSQQKIKVLAVEGGLNSVLFLLVLSIFEWVLLPSISNLLYLFSVFTQKLSVMLGLLASVISLAAFVVSIHALRRKFSNQLKGNSIQNDLYLEKLGVSLAFIAVSTTNFAISVGAISTQGISLFAAYFLLLVGFLIYKRSQYVRGVKNQVRSANLVCQVICFLWLARMIEDNKFSDNLTDSIITVLIIILDLLFILVELLLSCKCMQQQQQQQGQLYIDNENERRVGLNHSHTLNCILPRVKQPVQGNSRSMLDERSNTKIMMKQNE